MTQVLVSVFNDKIGMRDNNLYDGGYYYAELSIEPKKKNLKLLAVYLLEQTKDNL